MCRSDGGVANIGSRKSGIENRLIGSLSSSWRRFDLPIYLHTLLSGSARVVLQNSAAT
jgi:hypothetical protein